MFTPLIYKTDFSKTKEYFSKHTRSFWIRIIVVPAIFITMIVLAIVSNAEEIGQVISMLFIFLLMATGGMLYMYFIQRDTLREYLLSEYHLTPEALTLYANQYKRREVLFKETLTVHTTSLGTYVLKGNYNWFDFNSKGNPAKIPLEKDGVFIPAITEHYEELISKIKEYIAASGKAR